MSIPLIIWFSLIYWLKGSINRANSGCSKLKESDTTMAPQPFLLLTNNKNLKYLHPAKRLNPRLAQWALFFTNLISLYPTDLDQRKVKLMHSHVSNLKILSPTCCLNAIEW